MATAHTLLVDTSGRVWSCGDNRSCQLGQETTYTSRANFEVIEGLEKILQVAKSGNHSLFLGDEGQTWGCGDNTNGCLGLTMTQANRGKLEITYLTTSYTNSVFTDEDHLVWFCGQLPSYGEAVTPQLIPGLTNIVLVSTSDDYLLSLDLRGEVWELGHCPPISTESRDVSTPQRVTGLPPVKLVAAGTSAGFFVDYNANLWSYGSNSYNQFGHIKPQLETSKPVVIAWPPNVLKISVGLSHLLILDEHGLAYGSAKTRGGYLAGHLIGMNNLTNHDQLCPIVRVDSLDDRVDYLIDVLAQDYNSFFLDDQYRVWACGANRCGSLGLNLPQDKVVEQPELIKVTAQGGFCLDRVIQSSLG
jgi:alpha-tubulin suppressor-like RCC1 family protein